MNLAQQAIKDIQTITGNASSGFGVPLLLVSSKNPAITANISGLHTRHHLSVGSEGNVTNDLNAHAGFSEAPLAATGYPVRNALNKVDLKDHFLYATDSAGIYRKYRIASVHQDETLGYIRVILQDSL